MRPIAGIVIAAVALLLAVAPMAAQYRVSGDVVEAGTGRPISDAEVRLDPRDGGVDIVTKTNAGGMFEFALEHPGDYPVTVLKKGYLAEAAGDADQNAHATVTVDAAHPTRTVRFTLMQLGAIAGTVLDEVTREPIPHLNLTIVGQSLLVWQRIQMPVVTAVSDVQGHFVAKGLKPGKYFVLTAPRRVAIVKEFSEEERKLIDEDYDQTAFPGGLAYKREDEFLKGADTVDVPFGAVIDLGKLIVKKVFYHRIAVNFPPSVCDARETAQVDVVVHAPSLISTNSLGNVPCGKDFLITGFRPGNYTVQAWFQRAGSLARAYVAVALRADDENPHVKLALARASDFDGQISLEHGAAALDLPTIKVRLQPRDSRNSPTDAVPDAAGSFHVPGFRSAGAVVHVSGLTPPFYVKSMRFDGVVSGAALSLDPNGTSHSLEILLDDKPAALFGNVTKNGQRVEAPYVLLLQWPRTGQPRTISGDAGGQFQFARLVPGEYRVLAVAAEDASSIHDPAVLNRALMRAQKVVLEPNAAPRITLELVELK